MTRSRCEPLRESSRPPDLRANVLKRPFPALFPVHYVSVLLRADEHARSTMTPVVPPEERLFERSLQTFNAARPLQLVVPTSTRFAAPLLTGPDSGRNEFYARRSTSRLAALYKENKLLDADRIR